MLREIILVFIIFRYKIKIITENIMKWLGTNTAWFCYRWTLIISKTTNVFLIFLRHNKTIFLNIFYVYNILGFYYYLKSTFFIIPHSKAKYFSGYLLQFIKMKFWTGGGGDTHQNFKYLQLINYSSKILILYNIEIPRIIFYLGIWN